MWQASSNRQPDEEKPMKQSDPPTNRQMNLLLVTERSITAAKSDRQKELTLALIELLTRVAQRTFEPSPVRENHA
jgi:hypothetical protein